MLKSSDDLRVAVLNAVRRIREMQASHVSLRDKLMAEADDLKANPAALEIRLRYATEQGQIASTLDAVLAMLNEAERIAASR